MPGDVGGEEISRPLRIVRVAHDFVAIAYARDPEAAIAVLKRRRGRGYDPEVVDAVLAEPEALLRAADVPDAFGRAIDAEPRPVATSSRAGLESVARAFGEFADLKLGFLRGDSTRVAELTATAPRDSAAPVPRPRRSGPRKSSTATRSPTCRSTAATRRSGGRAETHCDACFSDDCPLKRGNSATEGRAPGAGGRRDLSSRAQGPEPAASPKRRSRLAWVGHASTG